MMSVLSLLHWVAGLLVLAEAFNKIERTDLFDGRKCWRSRLCGIFWVLTPWRWKRPKVVMVFKLFGWSLLAIGAAGALVTPLLHLAMPSLQDVATMSGFAFLIVRSRLKETPYDSIDQGSKP